MVKLLLEADVVVLNVMIKPSRLPQVIDRHNTRYNRLRCKLGSQKSSERIRPVTQAEIGTHRGA